MNCQIGFIAYGLDRASGGIGRYTLELLRALPGAGLAITTLQAGMPRGPYGSVRLPGARLLPGLLTIGQAEIAWIARQRRLDLVHDPTGTAPL